MAQKKKPGGEHQERPPKPKTSKPGHGEAAFDIWLQRGLHQMFDDVTQEPVPEELLKLIEQDRKK